MNRVVHVETGARLGRPWSLPRDDTGSLVHRFAILVVTLALLAGVAAYVGRPPGPTGRPDVPDTTVVGPPAPAPGLRLDDPPAPAAVLADFDSHSRATGRGLGRLLATATNDRSVRRHLGLVVESAGSPRVLYESQGSDLVTPASTLKLLTVVAALSTIGPEHRFETKVVRGFGPRSLVLVGGGDPLLTDRRLSPEPSYPRRASLQELAKSTARQLRGRKVNRVHLGYDSSLFTGPSADPAWEPSYVPDSVVAPISPLWVDEGRDVSGDVRGAEDSAAAAAARFGRLLGRQRIDVTGSITRVNAPAEAGRIAAVQSAPLREIVQHVVDFSDNEAAEVLLRQVAIARGRPASFKGGVDAVEATLTDLGIDVSRVTMYDGSGLSRRDLVPVGVLVDVIQEAMSPDHPELRVAAAGLPVAGFTGSLDYRFVNYAPDGLGVVRAKTGTLTGVHGLAGLVTTVDGELLVFAAVADKVPVARTLEARAQLDTIASLLAGCGC